MQLYNVISWAHKLISSLNSFFGYSIQQLDNKVISIHLMSALGINTHRESNQLMRSATSFGIHFLSPELWYNVSAFPEFITIHHSSVLLRLICAALLPSSEKKLLSFTPF